MTRFEGHYRRDEADLGTLVRILPPGGTLVLDTDVKSMAPSERPAELHLKLTAPESGGGARPAWECRVTYCLWTLSGDQPDEYFMYWQEDAGSTLSGPAPRLKILLPDDKDPAFRLTETTEKGGCCTIL